ncbi:hypothetical protein BDN72DRAFT_906986 [Pluteus cervinus]|uniref:Uncharacterized protein n=1 Tax=Pluteus cervinus TaxID=181527 RepID=A0ACD2ZXQ6_9AGAR|nr:hypothetical protein BDN72DRAFT_906986 [Pluteus cervinus]
MQTKSAALRPRRNLVLQWSFHHPDLHAPHNRVDITLTSVVCCLGGAHSLLSTNVLMLLFSLAEPHARDGPWHRMFLSPPPASNVDGSLTIIISVDTT